VLDRGGNCEFSARDRWRLNNWLERYLARERRKMRGSAPEGAAFGCTMMATMGLSVRAACVTAVSRSVRQPTSCVSRNRYPNFCQTPSSNRACSTRDGALLKGLRMGTSDNEQR